MTYFTSNPAVAEEVEEALSVAAFLLNVGFRSPDEIIEYAAGETTLPARHIVERAVRDGVRRELKKKRAAEARWPKVTDCDRLDAAAATLKRDGILLRQYFSCCPSCAPGDIRGVYESEVAAGRKPRAIVYFFPQDMCDDLFSEAGGRIFLSSARFDENDDPVAIQALIEHGLRANGLEPILREGRLELPMVWRRRTPP